MKKIINVTICIFTLFSTKVLSQEPDETDFFCCSINELYKTSTEFNPNEHKTNKDDSRDIINIEADETYRNESKQITILQGDTKIIRGSETIQSELTNVLQLEDRARLSGNVKYENEGLQVISPYAEYNTKNSRTDFISPVYTYSSLDISGKLYQKYLKMNKYKQEK